MRLGSERLYSRYGSFRVQGMWGSFAFDVVFRSFLGITVGLLIGLSLSGVHLKGRQVLLVQFVPALHVLGIYIWQIKDKVMRERKGITRWGLLFGLLYGLLLPSLAKTWF